MTLAKGTSEIDAWAEVAQAGLREGAIQDVDPNYSHTLHIDVALSSTTPHTGIEIIVEAGTDTGNARDNWSVLTRYVCCVGTAVADPLTATEPAAETTLATTDVPGNNMDNDKKFKFIEHNTPANSEIVYQTGNSGAGDTVTIGRGGLAHEQDSNSIIYDVDDAVTEALKQQSISIPFDYDRVRVLYNNNYDSDGSTVFTRCRITKATGI